MHLSLCICAIVPSVETRTRLLLLIHSMEVVKPTNTGQLAAMCLANSEVVRHGARPTHEAGEATDAPQPLITWQPGVQPLLLFPREDATPLADWVGHARPITLVVPDGTWRQAYKMRKRVAQIADIPCVSLPDGGAETVYRLRSENLPGGLATMEAIARAMGVLEGPAVEDALMWVFRIMVERTLWTRGELAAKDVTDGIPAWALNHDPRSVKPD